MLVAHSVPPSEKSLADLAFITEYGVELFDSPLRLRRWPFTVHRCTALLISGQELKDIWKRRQPF